jgi:hypothetical protein
MFIAEENHELWRNDYRLNYALSVAFHSHHCDITLDVIEGNVYNNTLELVNNSDNYKFDCYMYQSKIKGQEPKFIKCDSVLVSPIYSDLIEEPLFLKAAKLHTIELFYNESAIWLVYEGKEDPNYMPIVYTNTDLTNFDFSPLYKKMTENDIEQLLQKYNLI